MLNYNNNDSAPASAAGPAIVAMPYLAAAALTFLFYFPLFLPGGSFQMGDHVDYYLPMRAFASARLAAGELPQWTDALFGGFPFLSDPETAIFQPVHVVFAYVFGSGFGLHCMDAIVLINEIVLAMGAVFLARSLRIGRIASVAFAVAMLFNGFTVKHLGHLSIMETISFGLWAMGCLVHAIRTLDIRWTLGAGLLMAVAILGGHWQTAMYLYYATAIGALFFAAHLADSSHAPGKRFLAGGIHAAIAFIIGALGSAVQVLPSLVFLANSPRNTLNIVDATVSQLPLRELPGLLFPDLYQPPQWTLPPFFRWQTSYLNWGFYGSWEYMFQLGVVAFALGLVGWMGSPRRRLARFLFWSSAFGILVAMGAKGQIYPALYQYVPGFQQVRMPPRMMWLFFTTWGLLIALALDALIKSGVAARTRTAMNRSAACIAVGIVFCAAVLVGALARFHTWPKAFAKLFVYLGSFTVGEDISPGKLTSDIFTQIAVGTGICALIIFWLMAGSRARRPKLFAAVAIALMFCELSLYGFHCNIGGKGGPDAPAIDSMFTALPAPPAGRVIPSRRGPWGVDTALAADVKIAGGYSSLWPTWVEYFMPLDCFTFGRISDENSLDVWNISDVVVASKTLDTRIEGTTRTLLDTKWVRIAADDPQVNKELNWDTQATTRAITRVRLICSTNNTQRISSGTIVAEFVLNDAHGGATTFPLRLGIETADTGFAFTTPSLNRHSKNGVPLACSIGVDRKFPQVDDFFVASFDWPAGKKLSGVTVRAKQTSATRVSMNVLCMTLETQSGQVAFSSLEGLGYNRAGSHQRDWQVFRRPHPLGFCWMVPEARFASLANDLLDMRRRYFRPDFNPGRMVLVSSDGINPAATDRLNAPSPKSFNATTELTRETPERYSVATVSDQPGWLALSQTWYPGWRARIDGKPVPLARANGAMMAVAVPAGVHAVSLEFQTPWLIIGATISGAAWLLALGLMVFYRPNWSHFAD